MLLIDCPYCGPRAEIEFRHAGPAHLLRPTPDCDDQTWAAYLYERANVRGEDAERWSHAHGCDRFFNAVRHTVTDRILATYPIGAPRPGTDGAV